MKIVFLLMALLCCAPSAFADDQPPADPYEFAKWYVENAIESEDSLTWEVIAYRLGSDVDRTKPWDTVDPTSRNAVYTNLYTDMVFHATEECAQYGGVVLHRLEDQLKDDVICISIYDAMNRNLERCYECW